MAYIFCIYLILFWYQSHSLVHSSSLIKFVSFVIVLIKVKAAKTHSSSPLFAWSSKWYLINWRFLLGSLVTETFVYLIWALCVTEAQTTFLLSFTLAYNGTTLHARFLLPLQQEKSSVILWDRLGWTTVSVFANVYEGCAISVLKDVFKCMCRHLLVS